MDIKDLAYYRTGILVPLFTLRTASSPGSGDFLSLIEFGQWCAEAGIDLIQLLPVNDSGTDPSPYSALSAYALHPLFIRITALPEYQNYAGNIQAMRALQEFEQMQRLSYRKVLDIKMSILKDLFYAHVPEISADKDFLRWMESNVWVREYAVFRSIKDEHEYRSWLEWGKHQNPSGQDIENLWTAEEYAELNLFYAWLQYRLEEQFLEAAGTLRDLGIMLKGDIPILMNDDSVAVWAHREIFCFDLRAGAPPDMFSNLGQNWGFPIYNWEALEKRNYDWWRFRLRQAAKFYDAYRIDHVLGFFRIWTILHTNKEGVLGYFMPANYIHRQEFREIAFDEGRICWLAEPHLRREELDYFFAGQVEEVIAACFTKLDDEDFYFFAESIQGEKNILALAFDDNIKQTVLDIYRDRALIRLGGDEFSPTWHFRSCSRYQDLADEAKHDFEHLLVRKAQENERLWERRGEKLLALMRNEVDMLCCAEDLGAVPDCVPGVLKKLDILGLKLPRWEQFFEKTGTVFRPLSEYPSGTVCAPSVHDTSTLREWWEYEEGRDGFWQVLRQGACPEDYSPAVAEAIIGGILTVNSAIVVFQIQDLFALDSRYRVEDSKTERMNIPGTVQDSNWSYRMPMTVSDLKNNKEFTEKIRGLVSDRKKRSL